MNKFLLALPNILTWTRLVLTIGFIVLLGLCDTDAVRNGDAQPKLIWALVLVLIAGITDVLDGKIARKYNATSQFGRMFDPLVDKVMICGGFIVLFFWGSDITGVTWWMVGIILLREVMVTIIRQISESFGSGFGANWAGKAKMFFQTVALVAVIVQVGLVKAQWGQITRDILLWLTVTLTAFSGIIYLPRLKEIRWKKTDQN